MMSRISKKRLLGILAALFVIEIALVAAFWRIRHARSFLPMRVVDSAQVFEWTPADAPDWFEIDDATLPQAVLLSEAMARYDNPTASTFDRQLAIMNGIRGGTPVQDSIEPIRSDPLYTWDAMQAGVPAQCTDFAGLMVSALTALDVSEARLWHFSSGTAWNSSGHSVTEVWVPELNRWVMLDSMNNAYVLADGVPGSVTEIREILLGGDTARLEPVVGPDPHVPPDEILDFYAFNMDIVRLEPEYTPMTEAYNPDVLHQFGERLPGIPRKTLYLFAGEGKQWMLLDNLSSRAAHRLPVWESKALFVGIITLPILMAFALLGIVIKGRLGDQGNAADELSGRRLTIEASK